MEDRQGRIWLSRHNKEMYRIDPPGEMKRIDTKEQPAPYNVMTLGADGNLYFIHNNP